VQNVSHRQLLQPAQLAASTGNWSRLSDCLQDLLLGDRAIPLEDLLCDSTLAPEFLDLALQVLQFGSFHQAWDIAKILPNLNDRKVPIAIRETLITRLVALLTDAEVDSDVQWFAIRILSEFDHPQIIRTLIEVLRTSDNDELQTAAIAALSKLGNTAIPVMQELLDDPATRLFAVQALGQIRHSEIIPLLLQVVKDSDPQVRAIAIEALGSFHSPEITEILVEALQDRTVPVRRTAVTSLGFRHVDECQSLDLVEHLRPLLFDLNLDVCRQSAIALGRLSIPNAVTALFEVLRSPHTPEPLALEIVRALGWSNSLDGLDALERALDLPCSETLRLEIFQTLGRIESLQLKSQATIVLLKALQNSGNNSALARQSIALSLGQLGEHSALMPLIHLLADPDVSVRLHVISALKLLDSEIAYHQLEQLAKTEPSHSKLGQGIAIALQEWNP
jgi:HEAT repeat protein